MKLITLIQAAAEIGVSKDKLKKWLALNPKDSEGVPFYLPIGMNKMFETGDIERIHAHMNGGLEKGPESVVYFIGVRGFIKIGWTADWRRRFANLQLANPEPLDILLIIGRPKVYEKTMHEAFAEHRASGEWFRDCQPIREHITRHIGECWYRSGRFK